MALQFYWVENLIYALPPKIFGQLPTMCKNFNVGKNGENIHGSY
jgi:hypothetical protein